MWDVCISSTSVDVCKVCRAAVCMCLALETGRRDLTRAESQTGSDVPVQITGTPGDAHQEQHLADASPAISKEKANH